MWFTYWDLLFTREIDDSFGNLGGLGNTLNRNVFGRSILESIDLRLGHSCDSIQIAFHEGW